MIWNYKDIESFDDVSMMKMMSTYEDKRAINVYVNEDLKGLPIQFWLPKCSTQVALILVGPSTLRIFFIIIIFNSIINDIFYRHLLYHFIGAYFINRFVDGKHPSKNYLSVIFGLLECLSIKKTLIVLQTKNTCKEKNLLAGIYRQNSFVGDWQLHLK